MWTTLLSAVFLTSSLSKNLNKQDHPFSIFTNDQIIFASDFNITRLLVPADGIKFIQDSSDIPSIFFSVMDPKLEGGTCIYVLEGLAAYKILEGGRDSTADYSFDGAIYFGARDGLYKYNPDTLSAKKFGPFRDDIIQLQKANGSDAIFTLNADNKVYKITKNGTVKSRMKAILCALQFVMDTANNIYYISCDDNLPYIVKANGNALSLVASFMENFSDILLLRPAFFMENCIPLFADGRLYLLYSNGTSEEKNFYMNGRPSAFSIDAALYLVAAFKGKIYEYNVMETLLKSMFGFSTKWSSDVSNIMMSVIDNNKSYNIHQFI